MEKQEMLYCGLRYNNTINDISRKRTYDEKSGVYTSRPENINGNIIVHWLSICTCSPASDFVRCIRTAALKMWTIDK